MTERKNWRSKGPEARSLRTVVGLALAVPLTLGGCASLDGPERDTRGYSLSEEGRAEAERARIEAEIDGYRELFKDENLPAPVELIAGPLTITPLAEARGKLMPQIKYLDPGVHSGYLENLGQAQSALLEAASDPRLAEEVRAYFDAELSDATSEASGIYIYSEADSKQIDEVLRIIDAKKSLAEMISDEELKRLTLELLYGDLTIMLGRDKGKGDASLVGDIISKLSLAWQERARGVIDEEGVSLLNGVINERNENFVEQHAITRKAVAPYIYGSASAAEEVNGGMQLLSDYREANPQEELPAVKGFLLDAISAIDNPETAQTAMNIIAAVPSEYEIARTEAKEAALKQIMNNLARSIESIGPSDTAEEIESLIADFNGYLSALPDQESKQQLKEVFERLIAAAYVALPVESDPEPVAVGQLLLGVISNRELLELTQSALGGDRQSIAELGRLRDDAESRASKSEMMWLGPDGLTLVIIYGGKLYEGSINQVKELNAAITAHLGTKP
ncbi:hypothetical protein EOL96_05910 [Candidatus Saccharibacteria bacterium]|nr:hypothetical protein [Candidatus Saccharibacteria bacterium]